ncbi:MAG: hypothetical protein HFI34_06770 [Lachnospiraceae bacterium]|nr:hypothetical protein [Lachnospiraceae bacterium]
MTREQANREAKKIYEEWIKEREEIEIKAKSEGKWVTGGLDGNNHLFRELNNKLKEKLARLDSMIEEK